MNNDEKNLIESFADIHMIRKSIIKLLSEYIKLYPELKSFLLKNYNNDINKYTEDWDYYLSVAAFYLYLDNNNKLKQEQFNEFFSEITSINRSFVSEIKRLIYFLDNTSEMKLNKYNKSALYIIINLKYKSDEDIINDKKSELDNDEKKVLAIISGFLEKLSTQYLK